MRQARMGSGAAGLRLCCQRRPSAALAADVQRSGRKGLRNQFPGRARAVPGQSPDLAARGARLVTPAAANLRSLTKDTDMNLAKDALHVLGSVAPTIATALGGPFAGMAVNALEGL